MKKITKLLENNNIILILFWGVKFLDYNFILLYNNLNNFNCFFFVILKHLRHYV